MLFCVVVSLLSLVAAAPPSGGGAPPIPRGVPPPSLDEKPLFAWADRCPATAMAADLYSGAPLEVASASHAGKPVLRVRFRASAGSATGTHRESTWMLAEGCRAVALVREETGAEHVIRFVVAKSAEAPSAEEQATLTAWAGAAR
ncbi:MAG: hypothetical protein Q8P18_22295 [Pseudomonadota bacterium]|nr:hypothetical protein [Pseudomonadota bacterium]